MQCGTIISMEKNNQPLIITAMIVGVVLILGLAFILTRGDDDTATPTTSDTSETQTTGNTEEGSEGGQEAGTPKCDTQEEVYSNPDCRDDGSPVSPVQQISCAADGPIYDLASDGSWIDENGVRQTACEAPTTPTGTLPANWNSLSVQEKTDLNPFDCDHETQWVSAENGSCIDKAPSLQPDPEPVRQSAQAWHLPFSYVSGTNYDDQQQEVQAAYPALDCGEKFAGDGATDYYCVLEVLVEATDSQPTGIIKVFDVIVGCRWDAYVASASVGDLSLDYAVSLWDENIDCAEPIEEGQLYWLNLYFLNISEEVVALNDFEIVLYLDETIVFSSSALKVISR